MNFILGVMNGGSPLVIVTVRLGYTIAKIFRTIA